MPLITKNVVKKAIIYTDEYPIYDAIDKLRFEHETVNLSMGQYVIC